MPEILEKELQYEYNFSISLGDIALLDVCSKGRGCENLSQEKLVEVLYANGLDVGKAYQVVYDTHRGITNEIYTTNRFVGFIRQDMEWTKLVGSDPEVIAHQLKTEKKYQGSEHMFHYQ